MENNLETLRKKYPNGTSILILNTDERKYIMNVCVDNKGNFYIITKDCKKFKLNEFIIY